MSHETPEAPAPCCVFASRRFRRWVLVPAASVALGLAGYALTSRTTDAAEPKKTEAKKKGDPKKVPDQVSGGRWTVHDMSRPKPAVVTPGTFSTQEQPGTPPSDAVVLFDGKDLSKWVGPKGAEPGWKVENGYVEVAGKENIETREPLGDMQLHLEWRANTPPQGSSQSRGNSGVYLMGQKYEVQILDTFDNPTYADGGATAVYGQNPPLVNASRKPGEWQVYDIIWRGPRFDKDGRVTREATVTVLHNGVLTQDHYRLTGGSGHYSQPPYKAHPEKLPLVLQNHRDPGPVRFRNIWYRPLPDLGERNNKIDWPQDGAAAPAARAADKPAAK